MVVKRGFSERRTHAADFRQLKEVYIAGGFVEDTVSPSFNFNGAISFKLCEIATR